jgi:uncharacterized caspase-like protein
MRLNKLTVLLILLFVSTTALQAKRFAVVVGSNYEGNAAGIPPLELCERDANLMQTTLKSQGSYDEATVLLGRMVTASRVQAALEQVAKAAGPTDVVTIYFSGHGTFQRDASAPNGLRNYIVMFDRPHVSDKELNEWLKGIKTPNVTLILDCCFSGGIAKKGRRGVGDVPVSESAAGTVIQNGDDNFYFQNKAIIASSDSNETSIEVRGAINHGVFTYWFAQGLVPSNGDLNKDGTVTALEAFEWSAKRVTAEAAKFNHAQHPQMSGNAKGIFLSGRDRPAPQPGPTPPDVQPDKPEPPVVTPNIPNVEPPPNPSPATAGNVQIATTILRSNLSVPQTGNPVFTLRLQRGIEQDRKIKVRFSGKEYPATVTWVDSNGLKAATGLSVPLGTYTPTRNGTPTVVQNQVAVINVTGVPAGVHEVQIEADDYPLIKENIGVEQGVPVKKFIVASIRGTGTIRGRVFLKNFEQPLPGQTIWMPTVTATNQVHRMKSQEDGSFWFLNLPPYSYYDIKASFEENIKLDNQRIKVRDGETTELDIVLNRSNFK